MFAKILLLCLKLVDVYKKDYVVVSITLDLLSKMDQSTIF